MSLADDLDPDACLEACTETIEENLKAALRNLPDANDSPSAAARKYTILGKVFREIRSYTKEALKSVQIGSDSAAHLLIEGGKHRSLESFDDTKVTITGPDGKETHTTAGRFNEIAEAVQRDPSIVDILQDGA